MLNHDYTAKLLNLEDVIITKDENIANQLHIHLELPKKSHTCPACGAETDCIHDYRMQTVKDVPLARDTFLHLRKRRYRCACGKRFFEANNFLPRYHRATKLPTAVSVDEFKGNSGGQKYHSIIVDPENKKVLDILPNRNESDLVKYFAQFPNKNDVKFFVCDMNPHFRNVSKICFSNAMIVADRYHLVWQVYWAMERVRKNEQEKLPDGHRKYFKKSRYLLMKPMEKLTEEEMDRLALMFEIAPRLADAYRLKNEFLAVIRTQFSTVGKQRLKDWLFSVELMGMAEFDDCVRAYRNWFWEILNSMDVPWSNCFIEGCNNKTKQRC